MDAFIGWPHFVYERVIVSAAVSGLCKGFFAMALIPAGACFVRAERAWQQSSKKG
jgi:hypothetical protein